ncbi:MAG: hypothetical protein DMG32_22520 [Acidobacteria bacterium]|nr:MAG: hypothetical protein DMG32_22520 [Acidobacteriota bacterium]
MRMPLHSNDGQLKQFFAIWAAVFGRRGTRVSGTMLLEILEHGLNLWVGVSQEAPCRGLQPGAHFHAVWRTSVRSRLGAHLGDRGPVEVDFGWLRLVVPTVLPQLKEARQPGTLPLDGAENVSRSLTILMILLALAIAGREIPEISKLADDPSNDGQIVDLCADALPQPVSQRANTTKALPASKRGFVFSPLQDCSSRPALVINGQQLLLLTIQRT